MHKQFQKFWSFASKTFDFVNDAGPSSTQRRHLPDEKHRSHQKKSSELISRNHRRDKRHQEVPDESTSNFLKKLFTFEKQESRNDNEKHLRKTYRYSEDNSNRIFEHYKPSDNTRKMEHNSKKKHKEVMYAHDLKKHRDRNKSEDRKKEKAKDKTSLGIDKLKTTSNKAKEKFIQTSDSLERSTVSSKRKRPSKKCDFTFDELKIEDQLNEVKRKSRFRNVQELTKNNATESQINSVVSSKKEKPKKYENGDLRVVSKDPKIRNKGLESQISSNVTNDTVKHKNRPLFAVTEPKQMSTDKNPENKLRSRSKEREKSRTSSTNRESLRKKRVKNESEKHISRVKPKRHSCCLVKSTFPIVEISPLVVHESFLEKKKKRKMFRKYYKYNKSGDQDELSSSSTCMIFSDSHKMYQGNSEYSFEEFPRNRNKRSKFCIRDFKVETHISAIGVDPEPPNNYKKINTTNITPRKSRIPILSNIPRSVESAKNRCMSYRQSSRKEIRVVERGINTRLSSSPSRASKPETKEKIFYRDDSEIRKASTITKQNTEIQKRNNTNTQRKYETLEKTSAKTSQSYGTYDKKYLESSRPGTSFLVTKSFKDEETLNRWQKSKIYSDSLRKKFINRKRSSELLPQIMEVRNLAVEDPDLSQNFFEEDDLPQPSFELIDDQKFNELFEAPIDEILNENYNFLQKDFTSELDVISESSDDLSSDDLFPEKNPNECDDLCVRDKETGSFCDDLNSDDLFPEKKLDECYDLCVKDKETGSFRDDLSSNDLVQEKKSNECYDLCLRDKETESFCDDLSSDDLVQEKNPNECYDLCVRDKETESFCEIPRYSDNSKDLETQNLIIDLVSAPGSEESGYSTSKSRQISTTFFQRPDIKALLKPFETTLDYCVEVQIEPKESIKELKICSIESKALQTSFECLQKSVQIKLSEEELYEKVNFSKTNKEKEQPEEEEESGQDSTTEDHESEEEEELVQVVDYLEIKTAETKKSLVLMCEQINCVTIEPETHAPKKRKKLCFMKILSFLSYFCCIRTDK